MIFTKENVQKANKQTLAVVGYFNYTYCNVRQVRKGTHLGNYLVT